MIGDNTPFTPLSLPLTALDWEVIVPYLGKAHANLARLDTLLENAPNAPPLLAPQMLNEAVLSSRIEGTQATLEDVLRFEARNRKHAPNQQDIQEILNYRMAMERAFEQLDRLPLSARLMREAHRILLSGTGGKYTPGEFRRGSVFIGEPGATPVQATYTPPDAQLIPELITNLERYINGEERDVLVQMAIFHAQFEMIHPFLDGNGRIGRLLMPLFLYAKGAIHTPHLYLSEYFEKCRNDYYSKLRAISAKGDREDWIIFCLEAISKQASIYANRTQASIALEHRTLEQVSEVTHSKYGTQITAFLFSKPIFQRVDFQDGSGIPRTSAYTFLRLLEQNDIIRTMERGAGRRPTLYCFPELLNIFTTPIQWHSRRLKDVGR